MNLIAMSGGVDSSVAAYLVCKNAPDSVGTTLLLCGDEHSPDIEDARKVCDRLSISHRVFDLRKEFENEVIRRFTEAYIGGGTPNPCVDCNRYIKFGAMLDLADGMGASTVATGHYARVRFDTASGRHLLLKAADNSKDQSYMLCLLTQQQLSRSQFPLGELTKGDVRAIAEEFNLVTARKKDSQDICFVPDGDYAAFIERHTGKIFPSGDFVDLNGRVLGTHKGIIRYTIGQRKGLGLALPAPAYVCRLDTQNNRVVLCGNDELFSRELYACRLNLIACESLTSPTRVTAKIRYKHSEQPATIEQVAPDRIRVEFDTPQRAITKGQTVVFYDGDTVVGGGIIE